jgi:hypothetical protein
MDNNSSVDSKCFFACAENGSGTGKEKLQA